MSLVPPGDCAHALLVVNYHKTGYALSHQLFGEHFREADPALSFAFNPAAKQGTSADGCSRGLVSEQGSLAHCRAVQTAPELVCPQLSSWPEMQACVLHHDALPLSPTVLD